MSPNCGQCTGEASPVCSASYLTDQRSAAGHHHDAAGERSEQGRFLSKAPAAATHCYVACRPPLEVVMTLRVERRPELEMNRSSRPDSPAATDRAFRPPRARTSRGCHRLRTDA